MGISKCRKMVLKPHALFIYSNRGILSPAFGCSKSESQLLVAALSGIIPFEIQLFKGFTKIISF